MMIGVELIELGTWMLSMIAGQVIAVACLGCMPYDSRPTPTLAASVMGPTAQTRTLSLSTNSERRVDAQSNGLDAEIAAPPTSIFSNAARLTSPEQAGQLKRIELSQPDGLRYAEVERWTAGVELSAAAERTGIGLDVSVAPRAVIEEQGRLKTARAGAEVRLGQNFINAFDQRGKRSSATSWYMFAGADGEALCWDLGDKGATLDGVALRDQLTIGDLQAGIAIGRGGGQLSFGYVRREYSIRSFDDRSIKKIDDYAAISFTMRR